MTKRPVHAEKFNNRIERIVKECKEDSMLMKIPPMAVMEMKMAISSYYGGDRRAIFAWAREAFYLWRLSTYHCLLLKITDGIGWTKLWHIQPTNQWIEHWRRHGCKCACVNKDFPEPTENCEGDCIDESIPRWFKFITRWDTIYE